MLYYRWHIGDWRKATRGLTLLERAVYREMLDELYETEKPLPNNIETLLDLLGFRLAPERAAVERVLKKKWTEIEEGWIQGRAWAEILNQNEKRGRLAANGKLGGVAKHQHLLSSKLANAKTLPDGAKLNLATLDSHQPSTTNHQPSATSHGGVSDGRGDWAERIRQAYCRGDSPMECGQAILAELDVGTDPQEMLEKVKDCSAAIRKHAPGGHNNQFVPRAKNFFAERQWTDSGVFETRWIDAGKKERGASFIKPEKPSVAVRVHTHPRLPEPPCNWRAVLSEMYPAAEFPALAHETVPWGLLEPDVRREMTCECRKRGLIPEGWTQPPVPGAEQKNEGGRP